MRGLAGSQNAHDGARRDEGDGLSARRQLSEK
jgi:hypothetical protein